ERSERRANRRSLVAIAASTSGQAPDVLMGEDLQHAGDRERAGHVDAADPPAGDLAGNHVAVDQMGHVVLRRVPGLAGDLGVAVDAAHWSTDVSRRHRGARAAASPSARTMARFASSILKALWANPRASRTTKSAARSNAARVAGWPASDRS